MSTSSIEWTEQTWNPVTGCTLVSAGCTNCYAMRMAARLEAMGQKKYAGTTTKVGKRAVWTGKVNLIHDDLNIPLKRQKSTTYFVNSMSDLFHADVPFEFIAAVYGVMAASDFDVVGKFASHKFQILTKRPERAVEFYKWIDAQEITPHGRWTKQGMLCARLADSVVDPNHAALVALGSGRWPLGNVWLGTSCENQETADERIPHLLKCPAGVRFISAEPLLGPIAISLHCSRCGYTQMDQAVNGDHHLCDGEIPTIDWVIVGGESGPGARELHIPWVRDIVRQCKAADVACFVKQLGGNAWSANKADHIGRIRAGVPMGSVDVSADPYRLMLNDSKGGNIEEWPQDLRVREFPKAREAVAS